MKAMHILKYLRGINECSIFKIMDAIIDLIKDLSLQDELIVKEHKKVLTNMVLTTFHLHNSYVIMSFTYMSILYT